MNSKLPTSLIQLFIVIFCLQLSISYSRAAENCQQPVGRLVSLQGEAQMQRDGASGWQVVVMDTQFCPGDMLRVLTNGRAAVVLSNETVLRIGQKSTISFGKPSVDNSSVLEILRGVLHIFSHRPRSLKVVTPYVNGVVEGTEFLVRVDADSSVITVFEGKVAAVNQHGQLNLSSGQSAIATAGAAPKGMVVVRPRDAVQWTLYYPIIIDSTSVADEQGNISGLFRKASDQLSVGRVEEAQGNINRVLKEDPGNSDAFALLSVIAVVQNNKEQALTLANRAVEASPQSAAAGLALSYAQQAHFDVREALATLEETALSNPDNAQVMARLAELNLSVGDLDQALSAAQKAVNLDPEIGRTQTVLGFAHLTRVETEQAQAAFRKAIVLDQALPLARLGLGLAMIRSGDLQEGRAEIEIAAALDPANALIRSYLGKAYFEEKRDGHSQRQYEIAKALDPSDPTSWLYDAIRKQSDNRPVEALQDLQKSISLNDNRAPFRSQLLLDEDLATRSVSLGRVYNDLGFQQLALVEGWKSVNTDPANFSAHRFLADSYGVLPRHEIARVSEVLQSQLLQPINIMPIQPQMAERNLFILQGSGLSYPTFNEFGPLFNRNRLALLADGIVGDNGILGDNLVFSGVQGQTSWSLGQFHYETDGFRENNDQNHNIYNGFIQVSLSPKTSLQAEYRYKEVDQGDLPIRFNQEEFSPDLRKPEIDNTARFGFQQLFTPQSKLIGSLVYGKSEADLDVPSFFSVSVDDEGYNGELQHLFNTSRFNLTSGIRYFDIDRSIDIASVFAPPESTESNIYQANGYTYAQLHSSYKMIWTIGGSADFLNGAMKDIETFSPKLGLTWNPYPGTTLRAAGFKMLRGPDLFSQTIEPTQVAGFNQFFDDFEGTTSWRYGIGIDQNFTSLLNAGAEVSRRELEVPYTDASLGNQTRESDWQETLTRLYIFWTPHSWLALSAEYLFERFERDLQYTGDDNLHDLNTHRFPLGINIFHTSGLSYQAKATYVDQDGEFGNREGVTSGEDQFWVVDALFSYRLPKRIGIVTVEARNLFDEDFQFQDTDPSNPDIYPERVFLARLSLSF